MNLKYKHLVPLAVIDQIVKIMKSLGKELGIITFALVAFFLVIGCFVGTMFVIKGLFS